MKQLKKYLSAASIGLITNFAMANDYQQAAQCDDPLASVMRIMQCIENENPFCAASGYASNFAKFHNRVDTETSAPGFFFWVGAFSMIDFDLEFDHAVQVADNQVSLRYVETVLFNDGDTFLQHEHALVTVNGQCKMTLWDQYGDNKEQQDVEDKADSLFPF